MRSGGSSRSSRDAGRCHGDLRRRRPLPHSGGGRRSRPDRRGEDPECGPSSPPPGSALQADGLPEPRCRTSQASVIWVNIASARRTVRVAGVAELFRAVSCGGVMSPPNGSPWHDVRPSVRPSIAPTRHTSDVPVTEGRSAAVCRPPTCGHRLAGRQQPGPAPFVGAGPDRTVSCHRDNCGPSRQSDPPLLVDGNVAGPPQQSGAVGGGAGVDVHAKPAQHVAHRVHPGRCGGNLCWLPLLQVAC